MGKNKHRRRLPSFDTLSGLFCIIGALGAVFSIALSHLGLFGLSLIHLFPDPNGGHAVADAAVLDFVLLFGGFLLAGVSILILGFGIALRRDDSFLATDDRDAVRNDVLYSAVLLLVLGPTVVGVGVLLAFGEHAASVALLLATTVYGIGIVLTGRAVWHLIH